MRAESFLRKEIAGVAYVRETVFTTVYEMINKSVISSLDQHPGISLYRRIS
jgi:hypothetical protein